MPGGRVDVKHVHIGTYAPIRDRLFWQGNRTVVHWVLLSVGGKWELWVIAPYVMSPALNIDVVVLATSPCSVSE